MCVAPLPLCRVGHSCSPADSKQRQPAGQCAGDQSLPPCIISSPKDYAGSSRYYTSLQEMHFCSVLVSAATRGGDVSLCPASTCQGLVQASHVHHLPFQGPSVYRKVLSKARLAEPASQQGLHVVICVHLFLTKSPTTAATRLLALWLARGRALLLPGRLSGILFEGSLPAPIAGAIL